MGKDGATSESRFRQGKVLLLGVAASGALAVVALGSAGAANASCVSFSGINSGTGAGKCQTTTIGDTAIGIGNTYQVEAAGGFNTAIAVGDGASAVTYPISGVTPTNIGNLALAIGTDTEAGATGIGNSAVVLGNKSAASAEGNLNRALTLGTNSQSEAVGDLNSATVLGNNSLAAAGSGKLYGSGNGLATALTVGNNSKTVVLGGTLKFGAALGNNKTVTK